METKTRTFVKSITWQTSGLVVMTFVTWFVTGSVVEGGAVALSGALIGFVSYMIHERAWACVRWGMRQTSDR